MKRAIKFGNVALTIASYIVIAFAVLGFFACVASVDEVQAGKMAEPEWNSLATQECGLMVLAIAGASWITVRPSIDEDSDSPPEARKQ